jgi:hypothetical protein
VEFEADRFEIPYSYEAVEFAAAHQSGVETVGNEDRVPVVA